MQGFKHYVTCKCVHPSFKNKESPPDHMFVVFSVVDDSENFRSSYVQCDNCGIVHKVVEFCRSEILNEESSAAITSVDDVKLTIPDKLCKLLEKYRVDLATWQYVAWLLSEGKTGSGVVLDFEYVDNVKRGKFLKIIDSSNFAIESFEEDMVAK